MERLTKRSGSLVFVSDEKYPDIINRVYQKLAEYEDAEEQGLLVRLPVGVGDAVYNLVIASSRRSAYRMDIIKKVVVDSDGIMLYFANGLGKHTKMLGGTMFLTREEAEKALERKGGV